MAILTEKYGAIVVGAGHAGCEASLALARTGVRTLLLSLSLDGVAYLPCNPSIGGTGKGHLVREVDALGGEMGVNADKTVLQLRMLNRSGGPAVRSLRAQVDKNRYHAEMKRVIENAENLCLKQAEVANIVIEDGRAAGVQTVLGAEYLAPAVIIATGVYLKSKILIGDYSEERGPSGFFSAKSLSASLEKASFKLRRFKTGTPARADGRSIDYSKFERQDGESDAYSFSALGRPFKRDVLPCYLGYTNPATHEIIRRNLTRSASYGGAVRGTGARYCPSIEDKIVRFADKERHQFFLEPEGAETNEVYVQGLSTGFPPDVQEEILRSVPGLENVRIMRDAYAIEYDCIDSRELLATYESKRIPGLYFAGQINGTSGYEEAAAQGIIAGLNASLRLRGRPPLLLSRGEAYIGVMTDDLVTRGADEPYRMMTGRAEYRLSLRQDNADLRLTEKGYAAGLVTPRRMAILRKLKREIRDGTRELDAVLKPGAVNPFLLGLNEPPLRTGGTARQLLKRGAVTARALAESLGLFSGIGEKALSQIEISVKYEGYLKRQSADVAEAAELESLPLPPDADYTAVKGLRIEARQKLQTARPASLGAASRMAGITPADVAVLLLTFKKRKSLNGSRQTF